MTPTFGSVEIAPPTAPSPGSALTRCEHDRTELLRILAAIHGDLDQAHDAVVAELDQMADRADHETRVVEGIEARELLKTFEKTTGLQDRVSRSIARDLKAYRELRALEAELVATGEDEKDEDPRNEPNPHD